MRPCIRRIILHAAHHAAQRHCAIFTREAVVVVLVVAVVSTVITAQSLSPICLLVTLVPFLWAFNTHELI